MTAHKFRIAFCILCHKYTPVLEELIRILNVPGNEIFIHVDGKSRIQDFAPLRDRTGVHFLEPRTKVYWAGFSMVESTLRLFAETQNKNFHYIVLISGDTLPLCPISELRTFLHTAYAEKREFISTNPAITFDEANWVRLRHFFRQIDFHASCQTHGDEVLHAFCQSLFQPDSATAKRQSVDRDHASSEGLFFRLPANKSRLPAGIQV